ncbi:ribosomal protein S9/S16-domain-containing protein [Cyathus striatus]|nr:ribosomal protein S9/S16-domain-containing protein [Cyathus striatus]
MPKEGDDDLPVKDYPDTPTFYTTRSDYYDNMVQLEKGVNQVHAALKAVNLLPLPKFARESLPKKQHIRWKSNSAMSAHIGFKLSVTRYNKVTALLNKLVDYHNIASAAGVSQLANSIMEIMDIFKSHNADDMRGERKNTKLDEYGRSYTVGKRKSSAVRVWMIPVREPSQSMSTPDSPEALLGLDPTSPPTPHIPMSTVLINNIPLNEYFPIPADRERVMYPLKVAGMLGKYNVFALARGGGTSGQSGALAHGIAKSLVVHDPVAGKLLRRMRLTRRDPRMVERKKTNQPKARKNYTWVKR